MYTIKELEKEQLLVIYKENINRHFPADEVKPLKKIEQIWEMGIYYGLAMYETSETCKEIKNDDNNNTEEISLVGYAFFIKELEGNMLLLDYFAIMEVYRSKGMGSIFLKEIKKIANSYRGILLETEDIDFAKTEEEVQIRKKRDRFYEYNGVIKTTIKSSVYGVNYAIWNYPVKENVSFSECKKSVERIYRTIVSEDKYKKFINIC